MLVIYCYYRRLSSNNFTGPLPANLSVLTAMTDLYGSSLNFCVVTLNSVINFGLELTVTSHDCSHMWQPN